MIDFVADLRQRNVDLLFEQHEFLRVITSRGNETFALVCDTTIIS